MSGKILKTGCLPAELAKAANVAAIVNAVESGIAADAGAQAAIADAIADDLLLNAAFQAGMAAAVPAATDSAQGKVALNLGTALPGDASNTTDALTAAGFNTLATSPTANALKTAIATAVPDASTTVAGKVALATNEETRLPVAPSSTTTAVTPDDLSYTLQTNRAYPITTNSAASFGPQVRINSLNLATVANFSSETLDSRIVLSHKSFSAFGGYPIISMAGNTGDTTSTTGLRANSIYMVCGKQSSGYFHPHAQFRVEAPVSVFTGDVQAVSYITASDATLKENVTEIDPAKALAFRNGLRWVRYEVFSEEQVEIVDADGNGTGRYEVRRTSQGFKYGLIAQDVLALAKQIGAFEDVVVKIGEYFDLDKNGVPKKDKAGKVIKLDRFGLDYDAINVIVMAGEKAALLA